MKNKFIFKCFLFLIIFSAMAYLVQAMYAVLNHTYILWTINSLQKDLGIIAKIFQYAKDILIVIIFIYMFFKNYQARQICFIFIGVVFFGIITLFISGHFNYLYIISGIRMLLYFVTMCMFCISDDYYSFGASKVLKIVKILIIVESIIVFSQVIFSGNINQAGRGGFRYCGTFGNAAGLGYFTTASMLCLLYIPLLSHKKLKLSSFLYFFDLIALSISTGSRTAILSNIVIIFIYIMHYLQYKKVLPKRLFMILIPVAVIMLLPFVYNSLISIIGRGNLMTSGTMRIDILKNFFSTRRLLDYFLILSGYGIGYGTNVAYMLGIESSFFTDSTIGAVIYQYGLIGLMFLIIFLFKIFQKIIYCCKKEYTFYLAIPYIFTILIVSIAGNIFEQIFLIIFLCYIYYFINFRTNDFNMEKSFDLEYKGVKK